ncbi:hypothetical protein MRX96_038396 [Rhipicephalus microplus]
MAGTLKQVLGKMLSNKDKWQTELPQAVLAINAMKHRPSGHGPFRLMHGYDPKLPAELNLASVEGDIDESHRLNDLAKERTETREQLLQSQRKTTVRYDEKRRAPKLTSRDLVLLELSTGGALDLCYECPFEITALVGGNRVEIQRIPHTPGKINQKIVRVEQIRRCKEPLLEVTEPLPLNDTCA